MATLTTEQIEQKKQQLKQLAVEAEQLKNELVEAGATELSDDDLDKVAGGIGKAPGQLPEVDPPTYPDIPGTTTPTEITPPSEEPGNNSCFF